MNNPLNNPLSNSKPFVQDTSAYDDTKAFVAELNYLDEAARQRVYDGAKEIEKALRTPPVSADGRVRSFEQTRLIERHRIWKTFHKLPVQNAPPARQIGE